MSFLKNCALITGASIGLLLGCSNDPSLMPCEAPVTYLVQVKDIIDQTCALPDCHVSGFSLGDFTNFIGLKAKAQDNSLYLMVIDKKLMPPPASGSSLTDEERSVLECWLEQGAKE